LITSTNVKKYLNKSANNDSIFIKLRHHFYPSKSYQDQKTYKYQYKLVKWHISEYKNMRLLQNPHHTYHNGNDKDQ
jgi:hypothetical protein